LTDQEVFPKTEHGLRAWVGVGGTPESVVRAARHGFGLFLAIIGGPSDRFLPYVDLFERAQDQFGVPRQPVAVHSPGFVAETDEDARAAVYDGWLAMRTKIGAERGWAPPRPGDFEREVENGALYVGAPETVARKIAATVKGLGINRFDLKYDQRVSHDQLLSSIGLYGTKVVPLVKDMLSA
ncbi:MAG TPA: LLM class flavin-dependent oxidoreductase, partial [Nocardioides sp.]|nr:LLM class flavin-dependent oxidoreductase [Nocardioides sp.]